MSSTESNQSELSQCVQFLRTLPEFRRANAESLSLLAAHARFAVVDSGQTLTLEGEEVGPNGFIVVSGCISMSKTSANGRVLIVELLQPRDVFGLLIRLPGGHSCAELTARAIRCSKVLLVPSKAFISFVASHQTVSVELVAHLLLCLQSSYNLSRGLAHDRVEVRIAAILLSLAIKFARDSEARPVSLQFTRQQLADLTGTTPESAIRVTRAMQKEGLLDISRPGLIRVLRPGALRELVES